jgi:hypothetical protein
LERNSFILATVMDVIRRSDSLSCQANAWRRNGVGRATPVAAVCRSLNFPHESFDFGRKSRGCDDGLLL